MMKKIIGSLALIALVMAVAGCGTANKTAGNMPLLKNVFKNDFLIGAALNAQQIEERDAGAKILVPQQFNAITPENIMKTEVIHPAWNQYDFNLSDKFVAYGQQHNMYITGHTLVWHSQLAPFVHRITTADSLTKFLTNHINTVAGRYAGKINSWDVVNEALNEDGTLRNSIFLKLLGEGYLQKAFELAAKADPAAALYYNDYNNEQPAKRAGCIALIKKIQAAGTKINGVGIQGHWHVGAVPFADIEKSIQEYAALGLKVAITELDINVLPRPNNMSGADVNQNYAANASLNPYVNGLPENVQQQLAADYEQLFKIFLKYKNNISRVTFWGVHDGQSWLNGWPVPGRTNYPLIFDRSFKPKAAFDRIIALKK